MSRSKDFMRKFNKKVKVELKYFFPTSYSLFSSHSSHQPPSSSPLSVVLVDTGSEAFLIAKKVLKEYYPEIKIDIIDNLSINSYRSKIDNSKNDKLNTNVKNITDIKNIMIPYAMEELNQLFISSFLNNTSFDFKNYFLSSIDYLSLVKYANQIGLSDIDKRDLLIIDKNAYDIILSGGSSIQTNNSIHKSFVHLRKLIGSEKET